MTFCMNVSRFMNLAAIFSLDLESQFRPVRPVRPVRPIRPFRLLSKVATRGINFGILIKIPQNVELDLP